MSRLKTSLSSLSIALSIFATHTHAEELKPISVTDTAIQDSNSPKPTAVETDVTTLMEKIPGGGIHSNGAISGQTYYRGVFGPRMNVLIDDTRIESGGPNWMDPPLHYMPNSLVESFEVERGIDSVSNGSTLGTTVKVTPKSSKFSDSDNFSLQSDVEISAHSVDSGYNAGGIIGISNNQHRFHVTGSHDDGNDFSSGDGEIDGTEYERSSVGAGYGVSIGNHELSFDARYVSSKDSGTPSLPLDPNFFHTELYNFEYFGELNDFVVELDVFHTDIEHQMRNFELRPAPNFSSLPLPPFTGTDRREVNVGADDSGAKLKLTRAIANGEISFGIDGHNADHNAVILDPDFDPFFVTNFNNAEEDHLGFFTEWKGTFKQASIELGFRYKQVETDADEVDAQPANLPAANVMGTPPAAVRALRDRFNNADRSQEDDLVDFAAKFNFPVNDELSFIAGFARKTRAPTYIERYLWIPLNVNAGLGDGNNYIGNIELDPEWSNQFELGLDWANEKAYFNPRVHYQRINNYIQGVAIENSTFNTPIIGVSGGANGDATPLQFANVEAEIYGFDTDWGYQLNQQWTVSGQASYVRGKRRDVNDDLFHIAPPRASAALTRNFGNGSATIEGVVVARQTKISDELTDDINNDNNNNDSTPGYGLINLYGQYTPASMSNLSIQAGVENLLDKQYTDHLNGFNRVQGNGVDVGERLPGPGINAFVTVGISF
ncbi:MAG: TonB-dependent receptor [Gammaproteobacteria bacterium]